MTLTIDTTGFQSGTFELLLGRILPSAENGPLDTRLTTTGGGSIATTIINGAIAIEAQLAGDYSGNGAIDAPDYTVWRDTLGSMVHLRADGNGIVDQNDYTVRATAFVRTAASVNFTTAIPEPSSLLLLAVGLAMRGSWFRAPSCAANRRSCLWRNRSGNT